MSPTNETLSRFAGLFGVIVDVRQWLKLLPLKHQATNHQHIRCDGRDDANTTQHNTTTDHEPTPLIDTLPCVLFAMASLEATWAYVSLCTRNCLRRNSTTLQHSAILRNNQTSTPLAYIQEDISNNSAAMDLTSIHDFPSTRKPQPALRHEPYMIAYHNDDMIPRSEAAIA